MLVERADDLVVAAAALSSVRLPPGSTGGVGLVTAQAGPGLLIADALQGNGVPMPTLGESTRRTLSELLPPMTYQANPVDTGRPGPHHADVVDAVAADPAIDLVAVFGLLEPVIDLPQSAVTAIAAGRPVVVGLDGPAAAVRDARQAAQGIGVPVVVGARPWRGRSARSCRTPDGQAPQIRRTPGRPSSPAPDRGTRPKQRSAGPAAHPDSTTPSVSHPRRGPRCARLTRHAGGRQSVRCGHRAQE